MLARGAANYTTARTYSGAGRLSQPMWQRLLLLLLAATAGMHCCTPQQMDDDTAYTVTVTRERIVYVAPNGTAESTGLDTATPTTLVSALRDASEQPAKCSTTIRLSPGVFVVNQTLKIPSRVSLIGSGETVLDGGVPITGWKAQTDRPWLFAAPLPPVLQNPAKVHQLWMSGQRRGVARSPTMSMASHLRNDYPGDSSVIGNLTATGFIAQAGQLLARYNTTTLRCVTYQHWTAIPRMVINNGPDAMLNKTNELVFGCGHCQFCPMGMRGRCPPETYTGDSSTNQRYYLEDAPEFLFPGSGTFFSDGVRILYAPLDAEAIHEGDDLDKAGVIAARPRLTELVSVGRECNCAWGNNCSVDAVQKCASPHYKRTHGVRLENLQFQHTDTEHFGKQVDSSGAPIDFGSMSPSAFDHNQAASNLAAAALHFEFANDVILRNVTVAHTGGQGLWFGAGVFDSVFEHGRIEDVGATAVRIGESGHGVCSDVGRTGTERTLYWCNPSRTAHNVTVADSVLRDGGNIMKEGVGVLMQTAANCTVMHNSISQFRYTGVSVGWSWDYGPTATGNSTVLYNNISTIGMGELSDLACVYHLGSNQGHVTTRNVCTNVSSFSYGGNAFYTDQGSQGVEISFNIAHHIKCSGFLQNFGTDNRVINNVFAFVLRDEFRPGAALAGMSCEDGLDPRTGRYRAAAIAGGGALTGPTHGWYIFEKNIVYDSWFFGAPVIEGQGGMMASAFRSNLYWNQSGASALAQRGFPCNASYPPQGPWPSCSFKHWQSIQGGAECHNCQCCGSETCCDKGSTIADPLFFNPAANDFRLQPRSPARALGVESISVAGVGPRVQA